MFGKSAFGSTGGFGQPQQQQQPGSVFGQPAQQPQQQGSAFGGFGATSAPSAFGATPATTSAFGQPAQQSAFGAAPANTGFGATSTSAFGQARPSAFGSAQPSAFGAAQPAASTGFGGGGFGSTPTTSAFGSTAAQPSGGLFGQRPATSAFGGAPTTSAFGQPQQQPSAFGGMGTTGSAFGQPANAGGAAGGVNQGTAIADFSPTQDRDITTGVNNFFQTITAMPQYKNYSLEELRLQDYQQNRKTATGAPGGAGAFGASTGGAFGASAGATGSAFGQPAGATGGFGQQQQTSAFGQPAQTSAFGAGATGGGLFGQQQQQPATTSAFGQPAAGTSAFGASTSAFGQPAAASGFGAGAATGGAFGAAASKPFSFGSTPAPATGGFGQPATSAFGQPAASTGAFGQQQPATTSAFGGGFGQKPATTPATGGFGTGFGQPAATGGFGQPAATGGFGASTSKPASSFSFGAAAPTSTAGGFGTGFGATPAPATGGFGQPATGGLFGAAKPAAPTSSLFSNTGATGATGGFGGFGAGATGAAGTTGGLFGQKPATGLGGTGGGLFGNSTMGATNSGFGFGQQQQGTNSFNLPTQGGLTSFGTNPLQPGMQQQPLIATVDKNPYGNNPLFDLSKAPHTPSGFKSGASAVALDGSSRKSSNPHYPISPRVVSKIKLRGFNFHPSRTSARQVSTSNLEGISDDAVLGSGAFAPRTHNKKLVFDNDIDAASIVDLVNSKKSDKRRVMFDPQLEYVAAKENNAATSAAATPATSTTTTTTTTIISEVTATRDAPSTSNKNAASSSIATSSASNVALNNNYYISPSLDTLVNMPKEGLKHVQNLVVGRKGYGEIRFDQPVDLTDVAIEDIMGNIVVIEEKTVVVYPDQENKPAKGTGLNLPATIKIENCFSHDKNTGAPIKDPAHPRFNLFKERLRKRDNVEFIDYTNNGEWTFKVQEF
ncbi:nuclear pore protein [Mucor ambiguus]|uniref:Nuclear pore protein n=1 Tax=Mucor ambiguus TaxID=91626 RepID=A0A0C9LWW4_9FUNG|nr:nuclear pore protein [Mucor ambiguus]